MGTLSRGLRLVLLYYKFKRGMTFQSIRMGVMKYDGSRNIFFLPFNAPRYERIRLNIRDMEGGDEMLARRFEDPE